jgi:DNA-binding response OmpR family regulator
MSYTPVLLIERDPVARQALEGALLREGLQAHWARTSAEVEHALATARPSLAILNPRLAADDGWQVLRRLRRSEVPVIVMAPRPDPTTQRLALALGADDCVPASGGPGELATRARFVLQRRTGEHAPAPRFGPLTLAPEIGGVRVDGRTVRLTRSEYGLLAALMEAQGRVVPREQLVVRARAGARALPSARAVDAYVRSLRHKLGDDPVQPRLLLSVRGFGYRLAGDADSADASLPRAAFEALPDPTLVVDRQRRVRLLNRAATQLTGRAAAEVEDQMTCATLLRCAVVGPEETCPALAASSGASAAHAEVAICPSGEASAVDETVTRIEGAAGYLLMQLRDRRPLRADAASRATP